MNFRPLVILAVCLVGACAGQPKPPAAPPAPAAVLASAGEICKDEYPTGSHIPKTVCRTAAEIESDKSNAETLSRRGIQAGNPVSGK
jgi:hypothetical protein